MACVREGHGALDASAFTVNAVIVLPCVSRRFRLQATEPQASCLLLSACGKEFMSTRRQKKKRKNKTASSYKMTFETGNEVFLLNFYFLFYVLLKKKTLTNEHYETN